ncbi:DUF368 domain-containing protein [Putridiphycobacter roseus]|uniref:DUF368 domain-containing protein n=1 Tax=Putridiphycobacter roseus TaxID=2219161 RepID=A0A2W1NPU4_9FLAO|nr:DUF368 domain-containing protein [Putridiphycobacter roseus]PZE17652.1 DUF368 domain-containing protein [Putridiphycobacter roseus]
MGKSKSKVTLFLKGCAMGAADVVPGVSGGTIAFITGIYEELLESISNLNLSLFKTIKKNGIKAAWQQINGNFLLVLLLGIGTSLLTLAKVVSYLLEHHEIPLWSFFFGLVLGSVWLVGKQVERWDIKTIAALIIGTAVAYYITILPPFTESHNLWYIFICGCIAICAMILPGVSGSFILVLLGAYATILESLSNLLSGLKAMSTEIIMANGSVIMVFALGCIVGLISFSRFLNYLFKRSKNVVIAVLTGFLIGSLNKIWPWKETITTFTKHAGEPNEKIIPLLQKNISPQQFEINHATSPELMLVITMFLVGILILIVLDRFAPKED